MAETCTKIFIMKWRFHQYIFCLSNITAYCSNEAVFFFSYNAENLQSSTMRKKMHASNENITLEYEDDKKIFEFLVL